jgi:hypothetical protein
MYMLDPLFVRAELPLLNLYVQDGNMYMLDPLFVRAELPFLSFHVQDDDCIKAKPPTLSTYHLVHDDLQAPT